MNKIKSKNISLPIGILTFFLLLFLYSKFGPSIPFSVLSQDKGQPLVVSYTETSTVTPDEAVISLGFEDAGQNLKNVQVSVSTKSKNLISALKDAGIKEEDIKTTNYSVYPTYNYQVTPRKISGYKASVNYDVKIKDIENVDKVLEAAFNQGVNETNNLQFVVSDKLRKEKFEEMRKTAIQKAKDDAQSLANLAGVTLGNVINVQEEKYDKTSMRDLGIPIAGGGDSEAFIPEITVGETDITLTVYLTFEVR